MLKYHKHASKGMLRQCELRTDIKIQKEQIMTRVNFGEKPFLYPMPVLIIGTYD